MRDVRAEYEQLVLDIEGERGRLRWTGRYLRTPVFLPEVRAGLNGVNGVGVSVWQQQRWPQSSPNTTAAHTARTRCGLPVLTEGPGTCSGSEQSVPGAVTTAGFYIEQSAAPQHSCLPHLTVLFYVCAVSHICLLEASEGEVLSPAGGCIKSQGQHREDTAGAGCFETGTGLGLQQ